MLSLKSIQHNIIFKQTLTITILNTLSRGIGLLIPFFIAAWFGVNKATDSFFFAYSLILLLANIFSPVMESIIVPFIAEQRARQEDIEKFMARIFGLAGTGLILLTTLFLIISYFVLPVITNFSSDDLKLVFTILIESSPLVLLIVLTSLLTGTLNAYKRFNMPALAPGFRAIITILIIFFGKDKIGVHSIALGYVVGELFRAMLLYVLIKRNKLFKFKLSFEADPNFIHFLKVSSYHMMSMATLVFIPVINKTIASWLGAGNISLLEYAERVYMIPVALLSSGLFVAILSYWSENYYQVNDKNMINKQVSEAARPIGLLSLLLTLIFFLLKGVIVEIIYGTSKLTSAQLSTIKQILGFYLIGMTPYFLTQLYVRALLVKKKTKALFFTALFMVAGTIAFNVILVKYMAVAGIALGNSLVAFLSLAILSFAFTKTMEPKTSEDSTLYKK